MGDCLTEKQLARELDSDPSGFQATRALLLRDFTDGYINGLIGRGAALAASGKFLTDSTSIKDKLNVKAL